jgi:cell shape-determining protein MreC
MVALIIGILLIAFCVYAVIPVTSSPWFLNWTQYVLDFLRGGAPILAAFIGLISFFIGIADIKDKIEAKKEEQEEAEQESEEESKGEK